MPLDGTCCYKSLWIKRTLTLHVTYSRCYYHPFIAWVTVSSPVVEVGEIMIRHYGSFKPYLKLSFVWNSFHGGETLFDVHWKIVISNMHTLTIFCI